MPWTQLAPRRRQLSTMRLCTSRSVSPGRTVGSTSRYASSSNCAPASRPPPPRGLDPAHPVHQLGAVHHPRPGQQPADLLPPVRADVALLEPDGLLGQPQLPQHLGGPLVGRLRVVVHHLDAIQPRVPAGQRRGVGVQHHHRLARPRPHQQHLPRRVGKLQVPRQRAGIGEPRQVGEVLARAGDHGRNALFVHQPVQPFHVGDYLAVRIGHNSHSRLWWCRHNNPVQRTGARLFPMTWKDAALSAPQSAAALHPLQFTNALSTR